MTIREWIDIQADIYAVSEEMDPGGWEKRVSLEAAKKRVAELHEVEEG